MEVDRLLDGTAHLFSALQHASEHTAEQPLIAAVERYSWILLLAAVIGIIARRLSIPYTIALVVGGLVVEAGHLGTVPAFNPDVVLYVLLPPLLFDASFRLEFRDVRPLMKPIVILAVPGVFLTALIVGGILFFALSLPPAPSLLFGTVVAATDPVAVLSIFRQLSVPPQLAIVAESESLVNDGMAITLYTILLTWVDSGHFDLQQGLSTFALEVAGGIFVGAVLGFGSSWLTRSINDHLIEMVLSVGLAYGSYLLAAQIGSSGPLACVAAGIVHGSYGRIIGMSANTRQVLDDLWEFLGFFANAVVFLVLGVNVHLWDLVENAWPCLVAIGAVLMSRGLVTLVTGFVTHPSGSRGRIKQRALLLTWGGLRGALTASLVLALPAGVAYRDTLIAMAFGVILFTLVVQGLTLPALIRRLQLG